MELFIRNWTGTLACVCSCNRSLHDVTSTQNYAKKQINNDSTIKVDYLDYWYSTVHVLALLVHYEL